MSERWTHVGELFNAALGLPADQREAWVRSNSPDDRVAAEVLALLRAYEEDPAFLEQPVRADVADAALRGAAAPPSEGQRIGPYRIVREIGRGGMGVVFEAEQTDAEFSRRVAIKLVPSVWSGAALTRFKQERQILAALDHPFIARLIDVGTTADGVPFLIMEKVDGVPIDRYCADHALPVHARLRLLADVCSAVDYAHRRFVVHRDLKPSNILVTADGTPKLLDFGIAKLTDPSHGGTGEPDRTATRLLTPECASPEQVQGLSVTAATDVYALGVLLYRLLTGRSPHGERPLAETALLRAICELEPALPSVAVAAAAPAAPSRSRELRGDLDAILMRALQKEPERRYPSVEQFAGDIRRHLDGRPIMARRQTLGYRAARLLKRHTVAAIMAAAVLVALSSAVVLTLRSAAIARAERTRAERRFDDLRQLARSNLFELHDAIQPVAGSAPARNLLIGRALQYLDKLNSEASGSRDLQEELAVGYERIAQLQGNFSGPGIGDSQAALASYRKALAIREALVAERSSDVDGLLAIGQLLRGYSTTLQWTGQIADALNAARRALGIGEQAVRLRPGDPRARLEVAREHFQVALIAGGNGSSGSTREITAAIDHDRRVLAILADVPGGEDAPVRRGAAFAQLLLAFHLQRARAFGESSQVFDGLLASERTRPALNPTQRQIAHNWRANMFERAGDQRRALDEYEVTLRLAQPLADADPHSVQARLNLAIAKGHIGMQLARLGDLSGGIRRLGDASRIVERLLAENPSMSFYTNLLVVAYSYEAEILSTAGDHTGAEAKFRTAMKMATDVSHIDPQDLESPLSIAKLHAALGVVLGRASRYAEARRELDAARNGIAELLRLRPDDAEAAYVSELVRDDLAALENCSDRRPCGGRGRLRLPTLLN